jgi:hypothetical protein
MGSLRSIRHFNQDIDNSANDINGDPGISKCSGHSVLIKRYQNKSRYENDKKSYARHCYCGTDFDGIRFIALSSDIRCADTDSQQQIYQRPLVFRRKKLEDESSISGHLLSIGPPKHALIAIIGYPILAMVTLATKSPKLLP